MERRRWKRYDGPWREHQHVNNDPWPLILAVLLSMGAIAAAVMAGGA